MSDGALLTAAFTVAGGVTIYVAGQIVSVFFITPVQQLWRQFGHIQDRLSFYAAVYEHPDGFDNERRCGARDEFQRCAAALRATGFAIVLYPGLAKLGFIPEWSAIEDAAKNLIGLSNGVMREGGGADNRKRRLAIEAALRLPPLPE